MRLAEWSLHFYRLPYSRPVHWFNSVEDGAVLVLLRIVGSDGAVGVAEAPLKPTWSGVSPRSIAAVLEDLLLPAVQEIDVGDAAAGQPDARALSRELSGQDAGRQCLLDAARGGGRRATVAPAEGHRDRRGELVRDAAATGADGARGGRDRRAPRLPRAEDQGRPGHGDGPLPRCARSAPPSAAPSIFTSTPTAPTRAPRPPNTSAPSPARAPRSPRTPACCSPTRSLPSWSARSPIPVLVDSRCASLKDAVQFLERGATALSVKPGRIGITEARRIAELAAQKGANVCSGMYAESALGTLISLQFSCALQRAARSGRAELLPDDARADPARALAHRRRPRALAGDGDIAALIDWDRVERHAFQP